MTDMKTPEAGESPPGKNEKTNDINNTITRQVGKSLDELTASWEKKKNFLNRLTSLSDRTKVSSKFYATARENTNLKPIDLFNLVTAKMLEANSPLLPYLHIYKQEAVDFAEYVLEKEQLPKDNRLAIKAYISEKYKDEYMRKDPPTEKQIKFIRELGHTGLVKNKFEASEIISKLMGER